MKTIEQLRSSPWTAWLALLLIALIVPLVLGGYLITILTIVCIYAIACIGINLLFGYTGLLSVGHSAFLGIGAYAFGLIAIRFGLGFWPSFCASIIISGIAGFLIGIPALRLKGHYFVLVTLAFAVIINIIMMAWIELTGGAAGLAGAPRPDPIPLPWGDVIRFQSPLSMYYFILFFLVIIFVVSYRLINSLVGKTFIAIRDDENLTQSLGINTMSNKLVSFTISAIIAGIAGALFASYNTVISPDSASFMKGVEIVAYLIIGGAGTLAGPLVGPLIMIAIPEMLQMVPEIRQLLFGIILVLFIIFLPKGIAGEVSFLTSRIKSQPRNV